MNELLNKFSSSLPFFSYTQAAMDYKYLITEAVRETGKKREKVKKKKKKMKTNVLEKKTENKRKKEFEIRKTFSRNRNRK